MIYFTSKRGGEGSSCHLMPHSSSSPSSAAPTIQSSPLVFHTGGGQAREAAYAEGQRSPTFWRKKKKSKRGTGL